MEDPARAFRGWLAGHEVDYAVVGAASAEESLGLSAVTLPDEVGRIDQVLAQSDWEPARAAASWASRPDTYRSVVDAHLQYLAFWFSAFARGAFPHLVDGLRLTLCGILKGRKRTPYIARDLAPYSFVVLPIGFIVSIDLYFRAHFRLRDLGRTRKAAGTGCVDSNAIGGQDIEAALGRSWSEAQAVLLQLESGYLSAELFDPDLAPRASTLDHYEPDLIAGTARVFHELTGRGGPYAPLKLSAESQAAAYLCALFGLFHELSHQLVGDDDVEVARALGITAPDEDVAIEAAVDLIALSAYTAFVDEKSREKPVYAPIAVLIHPARYSLGPAAFHAVGTSIQLAEWIFYGTQSGQTDPQKADRDRRKVAAIKSLQQRRAELAAKFWPMIEASAQGALDTWHLLCFGAYLETRCVEIGLRLIVDRMRFGKASHFCDHYD